MLNILRTFINGLVFGSALVVPGVSGGTFAIILGFYEQLIEAVNHFMRDFRHHAKFLFPFGFGVIFGIIGFASVVQFLLYYYSFPSMMFFIGMIAGIIPSMYKRAVKDGEEGSNENKSDESKDKKNMLLRPTNFALIIIPIVCLVFIAHLGGGMTVPTYTVVTWPLMLFIFAIGIIAAASLLIPGLSGSFVLLLAGIYPLATYAVSSSRLLFSNPNNPTLILDILRVLGPLGIGVIIGILFAARLIERLLKSRTRAVYLVVLGLMIGSVYALLVDPMLTQSGISVLIVIIGLICCAIGGLISAWMGSRSKSS